jgi:hypothetical protein
MNRLMSRVLVACAAASTFGCGESVTSPSPGAPATMTATLDFEALPPPSPPTDGMVRHGCSYAEDGFALETLAANCSFAGGFVSVHMAPNPSGPDSIDRYTGSVSFANGAWFGVSRLTRAGGGTFTVVSIDLDTFNPVPGGPADVSPPQVVTFTGTRVDGTTVTQAFTTDTVFRRTERFLFRAEFAGVIKVEWSQLGPPFHQFDNVAVAFRR